MSLADAEELHSLMMLSTSKAMSDLRYVLACKVVQHPDTFSRANKPRLDLYPPINHRLP